MSSGSDVSDSSSRTGGTSHQESHGEHEVNVPIHEDFEEIASITYKSFEEKRSEWARDTRTLRIGEAVAKFVHDPEIHRILVYEQPIPDSAQIRDDMQRIIEANFQDELFVSAARLDQESEQIRIDLLQATPIVVHGSSSEPQRLPAPDASTSRKPSEPSKQSPTPFI